MAARSSTYIASKPYGKVRLGDTEPGRTPYPFQSANERKPNAHVGVNATKEQSGYTLLLKVSLKIAIHDRVKPSSAHWPVRRSLGTACEFTYPC